MSARPRVLGTPGTRSRPAGLAFMGDSLTDFWDGFGQAYHYLLCAASGGYLKHRGKFSTGGYTLAQIETTFLPQVLALSPLPEAVVIAGGTNDCASSGFDLPTSSATLKRIITALTRAGILPVPWTPPPRTDVSAADDRTDRWVAHVRGLAGQLGLPLLDFHAAVTDPATGNIITAAFGDTVHPNPYGHLLLVQHTLAKPQWLSRFADATPHLTDGIGDTANLLPSGYGLFTQGMTGSYPTGFTGFGNMTMSIVDDTGCAGNWARISRSAANTGAAAFYYQPDITSGFAAGDTVEASCRYRLDYPNTSPPTTGYGLQIALTAYNAGGTALLTQIFFGPMGYTWTGVATTRMVVPASTTRLRVEFRALGTATTDPSTADIAQVTITNQTALGLA